MLTGIEALSRLCYPAYTYFLMRYISLKYESCILLFHVHVFLGYCGVCVLFLRFDLLFAEGGYEDGLVCECD